MHIKSNLYAAALGFTFLALATPAFSQAQIWAQAPTASWAGPYVGAFGGYGWGHSSQRDNGFVYQPAPPIVRVLEDGDYGLGGGFGGGLIGYNYQYNQFILGIEGSGAGGDIKGRSFGCGAPTAHECGTSIGVTGDVRARIGLPYGQFLPYIAGGLAIARISAYDSLFGASGSSTRVGWTVGGGVEYKVTPLVGVRVEYLHSQFDSRYAFDIVAGVPERVSASTDVVRAGVTFYLNPPPPPAPPLIAKY